MQAKQFLAATLLLLISCSLSAQNASKDLNIINPINPSSHRSHYLSVQFMGLTFHPGGGNRQLTKYYPLKLDRNAYFVVNIGATISYDVQMGKNLFLRSAVGVYKDCAYLNAGFVHTALHYQFLKLGKHKFNFGLGPVFAFREDWHRFDEYPSGDMYGERVSGNWQYRFFPIAGEFDYRFQINDRLELHTSVIPATVLTGLVGVRWKLK